MKKHTQTHINSPSHGHTKEHIYTIMPKEMYMLKHTYISPQSTHANTQANMYTEVGMVRMEFKLAV